MADDNVTKVVLDLDNQDFVDKMKESLGIMDTFGVEGVGSLAALADQMLLIGTIAAPIAVALLAVKAALDLTEEAEHIQQVQTSFDSLTASVGLNSQELKENLIVASKGLVDETTLLQSANKAIVEMGGNASHLGEIMEIARKATVLFGGDLATNFDNLNRALANGNARMLRQYGIVIDATKAHQEYAKSIGTSAEFLSQAGQKQAIMNAALVQAKDKFASVNEDTLKATKGVARMGVAFTDLKDAFLLAWEKIAGSKIGTWIDSLAQSVDHVALKVKSWMGDQAAGHEVQRQNLEKEIELTKNLIASNENALIPLGKWLGLVDKQKVHLADLQAQKERMDAEDEKHAQLELKRKQASGPATPVAMPDQNNDDKIRQAKLKLNSDLLAIRKSREKDEEGVETSAIALSKVHDQEILTIQAETEEKKKKLKVEGLARGLINQKQYDQAVIDLYADQNAKIKVIGTKYQNDQVQALKNLQKQNEMTTAGFTTAWKAAGAQASQDLHNFGKMGETSFNAVKSHASTAFKAIGDGSKSAGDALKGAMLGAIGDMATSQGEYFLASGLGLVAGGDPGGAVQIAEGGALIALGSALGAMGSGSSSSGGASSGGSSAGSSPAAAASTSTAPTPTAAQQKSVTIAINGSVFQTQQTQDAIVGMVRAASDATDFEFKKIGQA